MKIPGRLFVVRNEVASEGDVSTVEKVIVVSETVDSKDLVLPVVVSGLLGSVVSLLVGVAVKAPSVVDDCVIVRLVSLAADTELVVPEEVERRPEVE